MKSITKRIISTLAICGALVLEAGAVAFGSLGKALNNIAKVDAAGTTVTYKQSSTSAASVSSGTAPTGSSVTFSNTYTTKDQLTKNNSMTYTMKGYAGYKITALSMSMHSNKSAGTGKFSLVAGSTTIAEIASSTGFNQSAWYGSWTQSYVTVTPAMTKTDYVIQTGEDLVLTISASANSLFCESITLTYEQGTAANQLATPSNIAYSNGTLTWDAVEHATGYKVSVKDGATTTVTNTSYTVALPQLASVSVIATDSTSEYIDSSAGTYTYVNYGTESEPISVLDALKIAALHTNSNVTDLAYVKGKLTENPTNTTYGNFHISDDGTSSNQLYVYGLSVSSLALSQSDGFWKFTNKKDFGTNELTKDLKSQDEVILKLRLYDFGGTMEGDGLFVKKYVIKTNVNITGSDVSIKIGDDDVAPTTNVTGYTLTSANSGIASIVNNKIHAVAEGNTTVTISKAEDSEHTYTSKTINVSVSLATDPYINPDKTESTAYTGTSEEIGVSYENLVGTFSATSNNSLVATVAIKSNSSGRAVLTITYVGSGNTTISLKDGANELAAISVSVSLSTVTITGMPDTNSVYIGKTLDLGALITVTAVGSCSNNVTWSSSDEGKATVDTNGIVSGVASGSTIIKVTPNDYAAGAVSCVVSVSEAPSETTYDFVTGFSAYGSTWTNAYSSHTGINGKTDLGGEYSATIDLYKASKQETTLSARYANKNASGTFSRIIGFSLTETNYWISEISVSFAKWGSKTPNVRLVVANEVADSGTIGTKNTLTKKLTAADECTSFDVEYCGKDTGNNTQAGLSSISIKLIKKVALDSIELSENHREFTVGDTFVGETVTAYYTDGSHKEVTGATFSGYDMSKADEQQVTASYTENGVTKTKEYDIQVSYAPVTDITIDKTSDSIPTNSSYKLDEHINVTVNPSNADPTYSWSLYDKGDASDAAFDASTGTITSGSKTGIVTVTASASGHSVNFTLTIKALTNISVDTDTHRTFTKGGTFAKETISAHYSDGSSLDVTDKATFSGYDASVVNTQEITVSYSDAYGSDTQTYNVTVSYAAVTGVTLSSSSASIIVNESFDVSTIGVTVSPGNADPSYAWSLESKGDATDATFEGTTLTAGSLAGTVTLKCASTASSEKYATFTVVIEAKKLTKIEVTTEAHRTFTKGDTFARETIIATYTNGDTVDVTNSATFTGYDMNSVGNQTVSVSFTDGEVTKDATYNIVVNYAAVTSVTLSSNSEVVDVNGSLDLSTITVTVNPENADQSYAWSLKDTGTTEASLSGNVLSVGSKGGTITLWCTAGSEHAELTVLVKVLNSITVESSDHSLFVKGDTFVPETIKAHYSDGTSKVVTSDATFTGYNMNNVGDQTVSVLYTDDLGSASTSYGINVRYADVTSVSLSKTSDYVDVNGTFDLSTITVTVNPENADQSYAWSIKDSGTTEASLTGNTLTVGSKAGTIALWCTAGDEHAELTITVNVLEYISIETSEHREFTKGDAFEPETIKAHYTDGTSVDVTSSAEFTGYDPNNVDTQSITVSYEDSLGSATNSYDVIVNYAPVETVTISETEASLVIGNSLDLSDIDVTVNPENADQTYSWTISSQTGSEASLSGNILSAGDKGGTVVLHCTAGDKYAELTVTIIASYNVENILNGVVTTNDATSVDVGEEYEATLSLEPGYFNMEVTVTMGDEVIDVEDGHIYIEEVTGDIKIEASATLIELEYISVEPESLDVLYGGSIDPNSIKVTAHYNDGTSKIVECDSISDFDNKLLNEEQVVVVSAEGETTTLVVVVKNYVASLEVTGYDEYVDQGKEYAFNGAVTAHYADGTTEDVTASAVVSKVDTSGHGPSKATVSFGGVSTEITINVIQTKTPLEPYQTVAVASGAVIGVAAIAAAIFFLLKKFKI